MLIEPTSSLGGTIDLPGDKSISHRYAVLGAMARGTTSIGGFSRSQDCASTLACLRMLGTEIQQSEHTIEIRSEGWESFQPPGTLLDAGNSGTTIRLLSALLAGSPFASSIQGDESLNRRPMRRILIPLTQMGATIQPHNGEYPPLHVTGTRLTGIRYSLPVASAQVKSCVLLAGLMARGETTVVENVPSRDHTERALPFFNAHFARTDQHLTVKGPSSLEATTIQIPGDFSAAVFFIIAALLIPKARLHMCDLGVNPSRTGLLSILEKAGARLERSNHREFNGEPMCDLTVEFSPEVFHQFPREISGELLINMIDEIPVLAVLGTRLQQGLRIRGGQELRKKESDRINSIVVNLRNLGLQVEEFPDGFDIPPGQKIQGGKIQTFGDHRIAMAFAIAGLVAEAPVELDQPSCVSISFPDFFEKLNSLRC
ncbi:MAG: 3-phosphoshikimate 1-carboxyvinyltransferase [Acidobacteriota bacterium]